MHTILVATLSVVLCGGCGVLLGRKPEVVALLFGRAAAQYNLPRVGRFISKWLYAAAVAALLSPLMPNERLAWQMAVALPLILMGVCVAYLVKYKDSRFKKEGE